MVCHRVESQLPLALLEVMIMQGLVAAVLGEELAVLGESLPVHVDAAVVGELVLARLLLSH